FPGRAERAHIEPRMKPAVLGRNDRLENAGFAQRLDAGAAGGVNVVVRQRGEGGVGPAREPFGEAPVAVVEERPAQCVVETHLSFPRTPASAWRRTRGRRARNLPSPCRAP